MLVSSFFWLAFRLLPLKLLHLNPFPGRWIYKPGRWVGRLCRLSHVAVVCGYFYQAPAGLGTPPLHLGCCSGFDIEGTSRPVVVPIPQASVAGTLNLGEELFPDSERQRWETEQRVKTGEQILNQEKLSHALGRLVTFLSFMTASLLLSGNCSITMLSANGSNQIEVDLLLTSP